MLLRHQRTISKQRDRIAELERERDELRADLDHRQRLWTELSFAIGHRSTQAIRDRYKGNTPEWINGETDELTVIFREMDDLRKERDELRSRVVEVERIGTKLQHDVAEAAGMDTLGEESACTDLVIEAVRKLRRERDELRARVDQLGEHLAGWCVAIDHVGADWDSWDEFYKNASCRPGALHDLLWPYLLDAHHEFALEDHYEWQRKNEPEALSDD